MPIRMNSALFFVVRIQFNVVGQCTAHYGFRREWLSTANPGKNSLRGSKVGHRSKKGLDGLPDRPGKGVPAPAVAAGNTER